ncbi:MAG: hypothetical protein SVX43_11705 [Cyanobacteriota bacterium]|nr:hypothetical protein [Cyanobacteriota bacterium]
MSNPNPRTDQLRPFQLSNPIPLAKNPLTVRVRVDIDEWIRHLPDRNEWLRRTITEAVERELGSKQ